MDTQELVEVIKTWVDTYRETVEAGNDRQNDPKWRDNMIKFASVIMVPESLKDTPAQKILEAVIAKAKEKKSERVEEIYSLLCDVENYLNDSLAV
ncbi:MAG TPA: hypothetical protein ENN43_00835 [bacterium]|nr:hypothetical protein [bacterium]